MPYRLTLANSLRSSRSPSPPAAARTTRPRARSCSSRTTRSPCRSPPSAFEQESGFTLRILKTGDAGAALNRALPAGTRRDVFFGADNNLLSRALGEEELFEPYESPQLEQVDERFVLDDEHRLTPVDHGEVCLNTDRAYFEREG